MRDFEEALALVLDGLEPLYLRRPDVAAAPPTRKSTLG